MLDELVLAARHGADPGERFATEPSPRLVTDAQPSVSGVIPVSENDIESGMDATIMGVGGRAASVVSRTQTSPGTGSVRIAAPKPPAISETDPAPLFRPDLQLARTATGYVASDPATGSALELNELELSLVRMFDGKRSIAEVLTRCRALGIPANLESVSRFIQRLDEHGFLATSASAASQPGAASAFPTRGQWEAGVRGLFQTGIRLLRSGKPDEAASYFEALLAQDPDNVEANELLAMAKTTAAAPQPVVPSGPPPTAPPPFQGAPFASHSGFHPTGPAPVVATPFTPSTGQFRPPEPHLAHGVYRNTPIPRAMPFPHPQAPGSSRGTALKIVLALIATMIVAVVVYVVVRGPDRSGEASAKSTPSERGSAATPPVLPPADAAVAAVASLDAAVAELPPDAGSRPASEQVVVVKAPLAGEVGQAFLDRARDVQKGEKLFDIVRVTGNPERARAVKARMAELEKITQKDYGDFVPAAVVDATAELDRLRKELPALSRVDHTLVVAAQAGHAEPKVARGASVKAGAVLAQIAP